MAKVDQLVDVDERKKAPGVGVDNIAYYYLQEILFKDKKIIKRLKDEFEIHPSEFTIMGNKNLSKKFFQYDIDLIHLKTKDRKWFAHVSVSFEDASIEIDSRLEHESNGFYETHTHRFTLS